MMSYKWFDNAARYVILHNSMPDWCQKTDQNCRVPTSVRSTSFRFLWLKLKFLELYFSGLSPFRTWIKPSFVLCLNLGPELKVLGVQSFLVILSTVLSCSNFTLTLTWPTLSSPWKSGPSDILRLAKPPTMTVSFSVFVLSTFSPEFLLGTYLYVWFRDDAVSLILTPSENN